MVQDVLVAREDPEAVLAAMADPDVRIVTLTVTEKGYCHEPSTGRLNRAHPDIVHDLAHPEAPRSAPGFLVAGAGAAAGGGDARPSRCSAATTCRRTAGWCAAWCSSSPG